MASEKFKFTTYEKAWKMVDSWQAVHVEFTNTHPGKFCLNNPDHFAVHNGVNPNPNNRFSQYTLFKRL